MDVRRIALYGDAAATEMSNGVFSAIIEDDAERILEISALNPNGSRVSPFLNPLLWKFSSAGNGFAFSSEGVPLNSWKLKKYGAEEEYKGVWRHAEMRSPSLFLNKVDMVLPSSNALYSAVRALNVSSSPVSVSVSFSAVLSSRFASPGSFVYAPSASYRIAESDGESRYMQGREFLDLRKAPLKKGGEGDASAVPPQTGTNDEIVGRVAGEKSLAAVANPMDSMCFAALSFFGKDKGRLPLVRIGENWGGRRGEGLSVSPDSSPLLSYLSLSFEGEEPLLLEPGDYATIYAAAGFQALDNPRSASSGSKIALTEEGIEIRKGKLFSLFAIDPEMRAIRKISKKIFYASAR